MASDDQQAALEHEVERPKRRYVHRRKSPAGSTLDIAFEKNFRTSRGSFAGRRSAADILLMQECERALAGSARALRAILKHHEDNQSALEAWHSRRPVRGPKTPDVRKLVEAALILDIFNLDVGLDQRSWYQLSGAAHWQEFKMLLSDWAAEAGVRRWEELLEEDWRCDPFGGERLTGSKWDRDSTRHQEMVEQIREFTADIYIKDPIEPEIRKRVLAGLAHERSPEATRWAKGQSGNLLGGAYKPAEVQLPFGYLEELVVVEVGGRSRELTRFEALISQLQENAINEDNPAARQLAAIVAKQQSARWTPPTPLGAERPETTQERELRLAKTTPQTVYECMATLGMLSVRAKKSYLLEPWIVELALKRLKRRRLNRDQQYAAMRVTRKPNDYIWPKWWDESLFGEGGRKPGARPAARKRQPLPPSPLRLKETRFPDDAEINFVDL